MNTTGQASQGIEVELTACGFVVANRDWVYDPGLEGVEYVFGPTQRIAGLDSIMYGVMKFPIQSKRWTARHRSLLAGIRREAHERQIPPSQALWFVIRETLHNVLQMPDLHVFGADLDTPDGLAAWGKRLRRAMNREVSRRLLAPERIASREVSLEELRNMPVTAPTETEMRLVLEQLLTDPRLTPSDHRMVRALLRTGVKALSTCCRAPFSVADSGHEYLNPYLQTSPVSTGNHQPWRLAVLSLLPQRPGRVVISM